MTAAEAKAVLAVALGGTVAREMDADALKFMRSHLLPLPYEPTATRVHVYVAAHKWCSCLAELLDATGVPEAARGELVRAVREGGQLVRDLRSMTGWSYLAPGSDAGEGAIEAAAVAAGSLPMPATRRAMLVGWYRNARTPEPGTDPGRQLAVLVRRVRPEPGPTARPELVEAELAAFERRYRAQAPAPVEARS